MILNSLIELYETLEKQGRVGRFGWNTAKISCCLDLDKDGQLTGVSSLMEEIKTEKGKTFLRPQQILLPAAVGRGNNILPNFLWDNAMYMLGLDLKGDPGRAARCFETLKEFHHKLMDDCNVPAAAAILRFLDSWDPEKAGEDPMLEPHMKMLLGGANLMFTVEGELPCDDLEIQAAWQKYYNRPGENSVRMRSMVSGDWCSAELTHPFVKGLRGSQPTGAKLVSFNEDSFLSYCHEQSANAPLSKYEAFAYTSALNYLIGNRSNSVLLGDTTVLFWTKGLDPEKEDLLTESIRNLLLGMEMADDNPDVDLQRAVVCILALDPNVARVSVRYFRRETYEELSRHVRAHQERLEIALFPNEKYQELPMWMLLSVMAKPGGEVPGRIKNEMVQAVIGGAPYPSAMLSAPLNRIRAERRVSRVHAAMLKAYFLHNHNNKCPEEVLTVALNESSNNIPYNLGRLFAICENIQKAAIPNINATITDKYFGTATYAPAAVFQNILKLNRAHLNKLQHMSPGLYFYFEPMVQKIMSQLPEQFPETLSMAEQGSFCLGYYHQRQYLYTPKNDRDNDENND